MSRRAENSQANAKEKKPPTRGTGSADLIVSQSIDALFIFSYEIVTSYISRSVSPFEAVKPSAETISEMTFLLIISLLKVEKLLSSRSRRDDHKRRQQSSNDNSVALLRSTLSYVGITETLVCTIESQVTRRVNCVSKCICQSTEKDRENKCRLCLKLKCALAE